MHLLKTKAGMYSYIDLNIFNLSETIAGISTKLNSKQVLKSLFQVTYARVSQNWSQMYVTPNKQKLEYLQSSLLK